MNYDRQCGVSYYRWHIADVFAQSQSKYSERKMKTSYKNTIFDNKPNRSSITISISIFRNLFSHNSVYYFYFEKKKESIKYGANKWSFSTDNWMKYKLGIASRIYRYILFQLYIYFWTILIIIYCNNFAWQIEFHKNQSHQVL